MLMWKCTWTTKDKSRDWVNGSYNLPYVVARNTDVTWSMGLSVLVCATTSSALRKLWQLCDVNGWLGGGGSGDDPDCRVSCCCDVICNAAFCCGCSSTTVVASAAVVPTISVSIDNIRNIKSVLQLEVNPKIYEIQQIISVCKQI